MAFPVMPTRVNCPQCRKPFTVELRTIVDVGQEPELKGRLLSGELNTARCPECGAGGMLSSPILYHDPDKELLISYVPPELNMQADQQERYIGTLVKAVMDSLPAEKRKAYFFQPKTALTMDGLFDTILEADGISKETLAAQRARMRTLNALLSVMEDDKSFAEVVAQHRTELDYEFLLLLSNLIDANEQDGNTEGVQTLQALRTKILALVEIDAPKPAPAGASVDEFIELLRKAGEGDSWRTTIAVNRSRLDYAFFQALTERIEAAEAAQDTALAQSLTNLRERILQEMEHQENMLRSVEDQAVLLVMDLLEASDLDAALQENRRRLDEILLNTLARLRAVAQASGREARAKQLQVLLEKVVGTLESSLPPESRLINQLMRAEYPDGTNAILEQNRGLLTDSFVATIDQYIESLRASERTELADHLTHVRDQVTAKRLILRA